MNTPFDLEDRLRATFDDIVPQLVARARTATEVPLLGEPAPARQPIAGTPRRWSILGAAAAVVLFAVVVWVISRPDGSGPAGPHPAGGTTPMVPEAEPAWYTALRPAVPERFRYLALVTLAPDSATFEAIDPVSPVLLRIQVANVGGTVRSGVTCDDGTANVAPNSGAPCSTGPSPFTDAEMSQLLSTVPDDELLQLAQQATIDAIDIGAMSAVVTQIDGSIESADDYFGGAATMLFTKGGVARTEVHVVSGTYPADATMERAAGRSTWAVMPGYAVRVTMDATQGMLGQIIAKRVVEALAGVSPVEAEPAWYTALRPAVPERFQYIALTAWTDNMAHFVAIDPADGKQLDIIISPSSSASGLAQVECVVGRLPGSEGACSGPTVGSAVPFSAGEATAVSRAIDATAVLAAVQSAPRVRLSGPNVIGMVGSMWPDWLLKSTADGDVDLTVNFGVAGSDDVLGSVSVVGNVYPRPVMSVVGARTLYGDPAAAVSWVVGPSGVAVQVFTTDTTDHGLAQTSLVRTFTELLSVVPVESTTVADPLEKQGTPAWYHLLRPAVSSEFQYLALESVSSDSAAFVAIATDGRMLRIAVHVSTDGASTPSFECSVAGERDPSAQPPREEVPCKEYTTTSADAIDAAALIAAAKVPSADDAYFAAGLGVGPLDVPSGWLSASEYLDGGASQVYAYGRSGDTNDVWVLLVGGLYPRPVTPFTTSQVHVGDVTSWWQLDPSGFAVRVTVRDGVDIESAQHLALGQLEQAVAAADATLVR